MSANNLPIQVTSFVGRERELDELARLLPTTRLLTLTGSGGAGKTRLALQLAASVLDSFTDGVWFIDLAPLSDPALMPLTVASVLGVREDQSRPLMASLIEWLRPKHLLLIMDNCEHLVDACASFAYATLHGGRETVILATSREALGIDGELAWRVPSLALPSAPANPAPEGNRKGLPLLEYASVRLFVERAKFANPAFRLTDANADAIAQICYHLDGIPLAIELAAARVKAMRVEQIAERLDNRFGLLTAGSRTALPRHQTLRSLLDWSHSLLSEPERVLLRRLSVFAGGWPLEAAEVVCADAVGADLAPALAGQPQGLPLPQTNVLDLLTHLVEKSLVMLDEQATEPRYHLLETIRQYAREKLQTAGEGKRLCEQHFAFFLNLADRTEELLQSGLRVEWVPRLEAEIGNFRAALDWACEYDLEGARLLAGRLSRFWYSCDHHGEALSWYARVLKPGERAAGTEAAGLALVGAGMSSVMLLAFDDAQSFLEQAIAIWQRLEDEARFARALLLLCIVKIHQGLQADACAILEANESLFRQYAGTYSLGIMLTYWGIAVATARADYATAKRLHEESLAIGRREGDTYLLGLASVHLGKLATQQGEYARARHYVEEGLAWYRQMGPRPNIAVTQCQVADVAYLQGDYEAARLLYEEALASYKAKGDRAFVGHASTGHGYLAVREGQLELAAVIFTENLAIVRNGQFALDVARCLAGYADLWLAQGRTEQAVQLLASEVVCSHCRSSLAPVDLIRYERTLAAARTQLNAAAFNSAWEAGRRLTREQAIALAQFEPPVTNVPEPPSSPTVHAPFGNLSAREREVAVLVAQGKSNRTIADELVLSERTVEGHVRNLLSKLGFHARAQIAAWVVESGLAKGVSATPVTATERRP